MKKLILPIAISICILCGCKEVPESVQQNMQSYGENVQMEEAEINYCSIDEVRSTDMESIDFNKYTNLKLPEYINLSDIEGVAELELSYENNYIDENIDRLSDVFGADKDKFEQMRYPTAGIFNIYDNEKERIYMNISNSGFMSYWADDNYIGNQVKYRKIEKRYKTDREDFSAINVRLKDGSTTLKELCCNAENLLQTHMSVDGFTYKISDVYVRAKKNAKNDIRRVSMCAEYYYKGIPLNYSISKDAILNEKKEVEKVIYNFGVELEYDSPDFPCALTKGDGSCRIVNAYEEDRVVDFESALNIVNSELSGFGVFTVNEVLPLYMLYGDEVVTDDNAQFDTEAKDNNPLNGMKLYGRPVYAFLVISNDDANQAHVIKANNCKKWFAVDMITGEFLANLNG